MDVVAFDVGDDDQLVVVRCASDPRVTLASTDVGSLGGLVALRDGFCHIAGSHLFDPDTGTYTLPWVERPRSSTTPVLASLWELLSSRAVLERVDALGGYSTEETGRRVR